MDQQPTPTPAAAAPKPQPKVGRVARTAKNATQTYLDINEIRDDVVVMKDGSFRSVLMASSINFDLKSEDEKNAVIMAYQGFINSLNFPLQIMVRSRRINLDSYLHTLAEYEQAQTHPLIRSQTGEYIEFITRLIEVANIMQKTFYVIVPFYPSGVGPTTQGKGIFSLFARGENKANRDFDANKNALKQRAQLVASGLGTLGVRAAELKTQELIELYYQTYNPELAAQEKLVDASQLTGPVVAMGGSAPTPGQLPPIPGAAPESPAVTSMNLDQL